MNDEEYIAEIKYQEAMLDAYGDNTVREVNEEGFIGPTAAELKQRKQQKLQIKCKQVALSSLRHKIMALYDHGCFMEN